jgi:transcriptional regulator with XRE-family HTH domain
MASTVEEQTVTLGSAIRSIRMERDWTLDDASKATGISVSTWSKVENGQRSLTYDKLVHLATALSVDISRLFTSGEQRTSAEQKSDLKIFAGRRSIQRIGDGFEVPARVYTYRYLAHDIIHKRFSPVLMEIHARSLSDFDELIRHKGDEFTFVLEGEIDVHTEIYAPLRLSAGESVFFDSGVGHAYVNVGESNAKVLCIGSDVDDLAEEPMIEFARQALASIGQT